MTSAVKTAPFPILLEALEARIAPAALTGINYKAITLGSPQLVKAGEGLSTSADGTGSLLLAVEKGQALVFTTDLNGNGRFDPNEITGVSAGNGLKFTSFVDINGDIVTNLQSNGQLTDSTPGTADRDGKIILNSRIEGITLRSVTQADLPANVSVANRIALSSYSIHGFIYAGGGLGVSGGNGLVIDTSGIADQVAKFSGGNVDRQTADVIPNVAGVLTGTAINGSTFTFGLGQPAGKFAPFVPTSGQAGGDVIGIRVGAGADNPLVALTPAAYSLGVIVTGDGGIGGRGGNVENVTIFGDTGGLRIVAGNGGDGINGGAGGSIINLSDLGSYNSVVEIRAGSGGEGFLGRAGAAGNVTLGTWIGNGQLVVGLGSGGIGLTQGGNGTSLVAGTLQPSNTDGPPLPVNVLSSWRDDGAISSQVADFNGDGFADMVFLTSNPNQLAVRFGTALGITAGAPTLYFNAPIYVTPDVRSSGVVIADFDGDGLLDLATASSKENSYDGIRVFLNDGTWFDRANDSASGRNFVSTYTHVALPYLPGLASVSGFDQHRRGFAITDMVSGDFNNDGITDIAYLMQGLAVTPVNPNRTNLVILEGLGDGTFFANFGYDRVTDSRLNTPYSVVYAGAGGWNEVLIKSSVVVDGDASTSRVVMAQPQSRSFQIAEYNAGTLGISTLGAGSVRASWPGPGDPPAVSDANIVGFTILDVNDGGTDGIWDLVAINDGNGLTTFRGNVLPGAGLTFVEGVRVTGQNTLFGPTNSPEFRAITTGDFDGNPATTEIALLGDDPAPAGWSFRFVELTGLDIYTVPASVTATGSSLAIGPAIGTVAPFDISTVPGTATDRFIFAGRAGSEDEPGLFTPATTTSTFISVLNRNSLLAAAGDGGASRLGTGGAGGGFGSVDPLGQPLLKFIQPSNVFAQFDLTLQGAVGGDGFVNGGAGGGIRGVIVSFAEGTTALSGTTVLLGGRGGDALLGVGGAGGSLQNYSTARGVFHTAGDGGNGMTGGAGGQVAPGTLLGNFTNEGSSVSVQAGDGGRGVTRGGAGGQITGFVPRFLPLTAGEGGLLFYVSGDGGDAVAGVAGAGGAISNSSPFEADNNLVGPIVIQTGAGGDGLTGGAGGNIANFRNTSTLFSTPTVLSAVAGNGGTGVSGAGGAGGSVSNFLGSATGIANLGLLGVWQFNRVIAGDGGTSFGGIGGAGGGLNGVNVAANSSAMALAAGRGGDGLTRGGLGGSVTSSTADSAGSPAKVVVFAGSGGNAYAAVSTGSNVGPAGSSAATLALRAFGGAAGVGGNGGSITSFTQPKTVQAAVDLIAGNGGSLMNYGSPADAVTNVGLGGSVSRVTLAGDAGRINPNVAITNYAANFVQTTLRDAPTTQLDDSTGNVGVVVGEAGRVRGGLPAGDAAVKTGSVSTFSANNIMSMVAGSVDRIAAIRSISGISVSSGGILGAYKNTPIAHAPGSPLYLAADGVTQIPSPVQGGRLMDGAIVTQINNTGLLGARIFSI